MTKAPGKTRTVHRKAVKPWKPARGPLAFLFRGCQGMPLWRILWWHASRIPTFAITLGFFRFFCCGNGNVPRDGPVLFLSNHQSVLDPLIIAVGAPFRPKNSLARGTLFSNWFGSMVMYSYGGIPIARGGGGDKATMRLCVDLLRMGQSLVIFPEGTRTLDGKIGKFRAGSLALIKRARPMIVPVAIEGSHNTWPRGKFLRVFRHFSIKFGKPIPPDELIEMGPDAMDYVRQRIETMRQQLDKAIHNPKHLH